LSHASVYPSLTSVSVFVSGRHVMDNHPSTNRRAASTNCSPSSLHVRSVVALVQTASLDVALLVAIGFSETTHIDHPPALLAPEVAGIASTHSVVGRVNCFPPVVNAVEPMRGAKATIPEAVLVSRAGARGCQLVQASTASDAIQSFFNKSFHSVVAESHGFLQFYCA
jgi:hypothetical protein